MRKTVSGFTIVELLIVIVVIAVLAAITVVAYNGIQTRARQSKIDTDVAMLMKAVRLARESSATSLRFITGSTYTAGSCTGNPDGTNLAALPSSNACWTGYRAALAAISTASGANVNNLVDPWGRPYLIDENEAEVGPGVCTQDSIGPYRQPFQTGYGTYNNAYNYNVPNSGFNGC